MKDSNPRVCRELSLFRQQFDLLACRMAPRRHHTLVHTCPGGQCQGVWQIVLADLVDFNLSN
jgi:hypothetical protein